jgi:hypothetical protein
MIPTALSSSHTSRDPTLNFFIRKAVASKVSSGPMQRASFMTSLTSMSVTSFYACGGRRPEPMDRFGARISISLNSASGGGQL